MNGSALEGACLTAVGEGGLSVFRVVGQDVQGLLARIFRGAGRPAAGSDTLRVGHLVAGARIVDEAVVRIEEGGRAAEISTHGGASTRRAVERLLASCGVRAAAPGHLLGDAAGPESLLRAEALRGLEEAWALQAMLFFLAAAGGALSREVEAVATALVAVDGPADPNLAPLRQRLQSLLARAPFGRAFSEPPSVVIAGPPNAGKSSLANALLGAERCIVTSDAGTTRDLLSARLVLQGHPFTLVDSAGLGRGGDEAEEAGIVRARRAAREADVLLFVIDGQTGFEGGREAAALMASRRTILVLNKADLGRRLDPAGLEACRGRPVRCVSALTGEGLEDLAEHVVFRSAFRGPPTRELAVPFTSRQQACLEQALHELAFQPEASAERLRVLLHGERAEDARGGEAS